MRKNILIRISGDRKFHGLFLNELFCDIIKLIFKIINIRSIVSIIAITTYI